MKSILLKSFSNEKGFGSLLIAFGVVTVAALVILQLSTVFQSAHSMRLRRKNVGELKTTMQALLGQKLKQAYTMGVLDSDCNSYGAGFEKKIVNGHVLCFKSNSGLCVKIGAQTGKRRTFCISTNTSNLDWKNYSSPPGGVAINSLPNPTPQPLAGGEKRTRFILPGPAAAGGNKWLTCNGASNVCFRMVLCQEGVTNCTLQNALGVQVVRLGSLPF